MLDLEVPGSRLRKRVIQFSQLIFFLILTIHSYSKFDNILWSLVSERQMTLTPSAPSSPINSNDTEPPDDIESVGNSTFV